ncbi:APC family permease [Arthrobacter sp. zg-Y1110]|uniref:APC family permease n=1 Tax=Arthrobacter sp. zg-Y1110 TaxID=2886932 RepID=UPI001D159D56|nr:APC family permease [Arthrobacter sp. zg-Y1110]MCC3292379.1 APC family permease [Arthrobacter sp. zg-Y1110]UWX86718.1 APC family permease [Arthrobacter sp. zg-Y1110]
MSGGAAVPSKGLKNGSLGLWGSFTIGLSSAAPAYSLAATLGLLVLAVGAQAPAALLLAFLPMLFTAIAYNELNKDDPDCGTTFTWVSKALGRRTGWMGGWALAISGVVVLANLAAVAGEYLWHLINPGLAGNSLLVTLTGVGFIALMTWLNMRGIIIGERMQRVMIIIQYAALVLFAGMAVFRLAAGRAADFTAVDLQWFNPFAGDGLQSMTYAVLLALFIYWGWDSCLALNEETRDPARTPGRAALLASVALLVTYVGISVLVMMFAGIGEDGLGLANAEHADDVLYAVSEAVMGPWAPVIVVAVLVSAVSSTQTTILPTARGTLAMAVHGALPARFAAVHARHRTPVFSTVLMGIVASAYYLGMSLVSENFLADSIASLGLFIAFYYGITAYACVWRFRRTLTSGIRNLFMRGIFPLAGALSMTAAFLISAVDMLNPEYGSTVMFGVGGAFVIGIGALMLGAVLMTLWYRHRGAEEPDSVLPDPVPAGTAN